MRNVLRHILQWLRHPLGEFCKLIELQIQGGVHMHICRDIKVDGNYNTGLYNLLVDLPRNIIFHNEHELREPLGIYTVSISRVFRAFIKLLEEFNKSSRSLENLDLAHKELLDSIMAYIDDGYLIMKCFYPKSLVSEKIIFADKWLKKVDKQIIEDYKNKIEPFRYKLALIVNKTKHNHARYCHVETSSIFGKVIGYYIEGIAENGVIQPNKEIHPMFKGMRTAISYNKDIRDQLAILYFISHFIAETVQKILSKNYSISLKEDSCTYDNDKQIIEIINGVCSLKEFFFPDEYNDDLPQITFSDGIIDIRKPAYKSYLNKLIVPGSMKIKATMSGDGVTKSWALPYF